MHESGHWVEFIAFNVDSRYGVFRVVVHDDSVKVSRGYMMQNEYQSLFSIKIKCEFTKLGMIFLSVSNYEGNTFY